MAKRRLTADEIVREVQRVARQQVINRTDGRGMDEVAEAWAPAFEQLAENIRTAQPHQVQGLISDTMRELARSATRPMQRSIRDGAIIGMQTSDREHEALTGPEGPIRSTTRQAAGISSSVSRERAREIARERISGQTAHDGVRLSTRLHRQAREVGEHATSIVRSSIEARQGIGEASRQFLEVARDQMNIRTPRYIDEITQAARLARDTGDRRHLMETIERHRAQMNALGQGRGRADGAESIRSSVRQFVGQVQLRPEDVDRLLAQHMDDRAQYVARRIMRHETAEAMRTAHLESLTGKPYVHGIRWTLSGAHPRADICDLYANQALHGLGPGGYPLDDVPETPHPMCLCAHVAILDEQHFSRQGAIRRGEPEPPRTWEDPTHQTAHDWLAQQPESMRRQILGPTRLEIFDRSAEDRNRVIDAEGRPVGVKAVVENLTRPAPIYSTPRASARLNPLEGLSGRHVGAGPLEGRGRDVLVALGDASPGWEGRARGEMRDAITESFPGIRLREPTRFDRSHVLTVEPLLDSGMSGDHAFATRAISIDAELMTHVRAGARAAQRGRPLTERQARGALVALHEEMHGTSPMAPLVYADDVGRVVEEMTNESLARTLGVRLGMLTEEQALRIGAYPRAMSETLAWVGEHVPGMSEASGAERLARLANASHRLRTRSTSITDADDYADALLRALDVPTAGRETARNGLRRIEPALRATPEPLP